MDLRYCIAWVLCGIKILFVDFISDKYPPLLLSISAIIAISCTLEALDTYHFSVGLIVVEKLHLTPPVCSLLIFGLFVWVGSQMSSLLMIAAGVMAANGVAIMLMIIISMRSSKVVFQTFSSLAALFYMAFGILLVIYLFPSLSLVETIGHEYYNRECGFRRSYYWPSQLI